MSSIKTEFDKPSCGRKATQLLWTQGHTAGTMSSATQGRWLPAWKKRRRRKVVVAVDNEGEMEEKGHIIRSIKTSFLVLLFFSDLVSDKSYRWPCVKRSPSLVYVFQRVYSTYAMDTPIFKSHHGLIGREYPERKMFITSPNSYHLPDEIWGHQQVRLRRNYHYGEHDPLLMPQYLDPRVIYLSLIRLPDAEPPFHILWRRPEEDEFEVMDGFKLAELPIGRLQKEFVEALERAYHQLYHSVNDARPSSSSDTPATPSLRSDSKFKDYCGRIRFLLAHLTTAVLPFSEALMCSCVCQRNILEMDAYITWMLYVKPTWGEAHSWRKTKTRSVAGIPVWWARRLPVTPDVCVMTWHSETKPLPTMRSVIEKFTSFEDESPPHPVIWEGSLNSLEYYAAMSKHNRSIAFPASLFDDPQPDPPSATTSAQLETAVATGSSNTPVPLPGPVRTSRPCRQPQKPYPARAPRPASSLSRNKFEPLASPLMPPLVVNWTAAAARCLSWIRGAEAALLANLANEKTRRGFFVMYMKLASLLAYRVGFLDPAKAGLSNDDWRHILGLEVLGSKEGTKSNAARQKLINELQSLTSTSRGRVATPKVDLTKLKDVVPTWKGVAYPDTIPDETYTSILSNLTRNNFKSDVLMADFHLYDKTSATSHMAVDREREDGEVDGEVDDLAPSEGCTQREKLGGIEGFSAARMGFGSQDLTKRTAASYNLYRIMRGWRSPYNVIPSDVETAVQRLAPSQQPSVEEVDHAEYLVARRYILGIF
ncbi:hypothetical protein BDP27DRAFT_1376103 [Rhodocollybia butyracea]|uniref:Uncharacterized protein n=1 Tax=Rhodocollybia butyracea TaxID=206335 RepID=A0A9P5P5B2_9AGAR|nr:hypothetical protein BDP27DRAFT_1376103 [Rhodocollybia butyracea]